MRDARPFRSLAAPARQHAAARAPADRAFASDAGCGERGPSTSGSHAQCAEAAPRPAGDGVPPYLRFASVARNLSVIRSSDDRKQTRTYSPKSMSAHSCHVPCSAARHAYRRPSKSFFCRYNLFDAYLKGKDNHCGETSPGRVSDRRKSVRPDVAFVAVSAEGHARSAGTATSRMRNCTRSRPCHRSMEIEPAT